MPPGMITAIAYLITEALIQGVKMAELLKELRDTPGVTPDMWQEIINDMDSAKQAWDEAQMALPLMSDPLPE